MKVIATKQGYHGRLRDAGDVFDVPAGSKASWFEPFDDGKQPEKAGKKTAEKESSPDGKQPEKAAGLV